MADMPQYVQPVAPIIHHVVHNAPHYAKPVITGVSYMTAIIASSISFLVGGGLAWYIRGRGLSGVEIDIGNIKNDVANLKAKVSPVATPAAA